MNQVRPADIARIARCLDPLETRMVFLGGAIVPLLLDKPGLSDIRQTMDIDLVVEVVTRLDYSKIEEKLIALKFAPDTSEDADCRRVLARKGTHRHPRRRDMCGGTAEGTAGSCNCQLSVS